MQRETLDPYKTSDLDLAAFLLSHNVDLIESLLDGKKATFYFRPDPTIPQLATSFYNDPYVRLHKFLKAKETLHDIMTQLKLERAA